MIKINDANVVFIYRGFKISWSTFYASSGIRVFYGLDSRDVTSHFSRYDDDNDIVGSLDSIIDIKAKIDSYDDLKTAIRFGGIDD